MGEMQDILVKSAPDTGDDLSKFADSYASFNRIINSLQRKYIELSEDFSSQNDQLVAANKQLLEFSSRNADATDFLNSILNSIAAGVVAVDRSGTITHFNPAASLLLGLSQDEVLGRHYREVIPPGDPITANALRAAETGRAVDSVEKQITLPDGTRLNLSVSTAILRNKDHEANGAVEVFHDLTKIKRLEHEIARLNTLAALGEMAAAVAHQVRNPLSGILGYGSLLKRDLPDDDPRQKLVSKITDGVETLNNTVTTLLNYTRNEELNREHLPLADFLATTVRQFKREHPEQVADMSMDIIREPSGSEDTDIWIDPVLFKQVLYNLFTNGCEACQGTGTIGVEWRPMPRQSAIETYGKRLALDSYETIVEIRVTDSGPGLNEDVRSRLFAPFFTTKDTGNGLGLAVAWKIMKAHGGDIKADNGRTGGAMFTLLLPLSTGVYSRAVR